MTVLATVGFGDIAPVTTIARVAVMVQMVLDIAFIGLAAKVLFGAADRLSGVPRWACHLDRVMPLPITASVISEESERR